MHREIKIGQVLKRLLRERRKSLKEISRETSIPYSTLHTWQENRQPKDILKAQKLADYFAITLHQLLFDESDSHDGSSELIPEFIRGKFEITVRRIE